MVNRAEADAKARLISEMNTGRFFINYAGHGANSVWANTGFFGKADAAALTNSNNLTVFTMLTCFNGIFTHPELASEGLAETLLKPFAGRNKQHYGQPRRSGCQSSSY